MRNGYARIIALIVSATSAIVATALAMSALVEAVHYSPYENPGALHAALWLGLAAAACFAIPVAIGVTAILLPAARSYRTWKRNLTPQERVAVNLAQFAALEGVHLAWSHHNREVSERLTESVMGGPQPGEPGWMPHPGWGLEDVFK